MKEKPQSFLLKECKTIGEVMIICGNKRKISKENREDQMCARKKTYTCLEKPSHAKSMSFSLKICLAYQQQQQQNNNSKRRRRRKK